MGYESVTLTATGTAEADWIRIDFRVKDVPGAADRLLGSLAEIGGRAARQRGGRDDDSPAPQPH
jgi:hypothetical protein